MELPPSESGAVKVTVALVLPAVAVPMCGAPGTDLMVKPLVKVPLPVSVLVTTTFHVPMATPVIGQEPDTRVVELEKEKPVQVTAV